MQSFFFDTYAFYEVIVGNQSYLPFTKDVNIVTTQLNLMELYYQLLAVYNKSDAIGFFKRYEEFIVPISTEIIIESMDFRKQHYKQDLSYVDCIGYIMAKKMNIPFLTGDKQFEEIANVKFVK